jgi:predicted acyltransferase
MVCAGLLLLIAGQILSHWLPINKSIWTSTFSIFMAGLALVCLTFFYWFIDIAGFSRWTRPLIILGLNPLTLYVLPQVLDTMFRSVNLAALSVNMESAFLPFRIFSVPIVKLGIAPLLYPLGILMSIFLIAWIMWQKRIVVKI